MFSAISKHESINGIFICSRPSNQIERRSDYYRLEIPHRRTHTTRKCRPIHSKQYRTINVIFWFQLYYPVNFKSSKLCEKTSSHRKFSRQQRSYIYQQNCTLKFNTPITYKTFTIPIRLQPKLNTHKKTNTIETHTFDIGRMQEPSSQNRNDTNETDHLTGTEIYRNRPTKNYSIAPTI